MNLIFTCQMWIMKLEIRQRSEHLGLKQWFPIYLWQSIDWFLPWYYCFKAIFFLETVFSITNSLPQTIYICYLMQTNVSVNPTETNSSPVNSSHSLTWYKVMVLLFICSWGLFWVPHIFSQTPWTIFKFFSLQIFLRCPFLQKSFLISPPDSPIVCILDSGVWMASLTHAQSV